MGILDVFVINNQLRNLGFVLISLHLMWSLVETAIRFIRGSLSLISRLISELSQGADAAEIHTLFFLN